MFSNVIKQISIDDILIDRENRQRTQLTFDSILPLAFSIATSQWVSPILVDQDTHYLIAGERRLLSVKALRAATKNDYSGFTDQQSARELLFPVCTCQIDSWQQWNKIPAQLGKNFTETDLAMYEFIENAQRQNLPWQDKAKAIYEINAKGLSQDAEWTTASTANLLGISRASVTENIRVWRVYADESADEELKTLIKESATIRSAAQNIERYTSRREVGLGVSLASGGATVPKPKLETPLCKKPGPSPLTDVYKNKTSEPFDLEDDDKPSDKIIFNADFNTWAANYNEEPFNFIHCDFPYGINFNTGKETSRIGNTILGDYDDSEDTYWKLLNTLKTNRHLIAPQAHIMFWFSQNLRRETEDFFTEMGGVVQKFLMVWGCGNDGISPDSLRYGRRNYETAMLISFGDRKIVEPRCLLIDSLREVDTRIHRSQKPLRVLNHFFEMFVDSSSNVLDPTAGSGTSLVAAVKQKARRVVGLEVNPDIYSKACDYINSMGVTL